MEVSSAPSCDRCVAIGSTALAGIAVGCCACWQLAELSDGALAAASKPESVNGGVLAGTCWPRSVIIGVVSVGVAVLALGLALASWLALAWFGSPKAAQFTEGSAAAWEGALAKWSDETEPGELAAWGGATLLLALALWPGKAMTGSALCSLEGSGTGVGGRGRWRVRKLALALREPALALWPWKGSVSCVGPVAGGAGGDGCSGSGGSSVVGLNKVDYWRAALSVMRNVASPSLTQGGRRSPIGSRRCPPPPRRRRWPIRRRGSIES